MGWAKLPFYSLNGERGALYLRYGRRDVSGLPCSASVLATLSFLEAAATSPLQALPEASEQEHAVGRSAGLCRSFAEWKAAQRGKGAGAPQQALQAALEHGGFGLRLRQPSRDGRVMLAVPVDIKLPRGLLASLDAAEPRSGRARDFFDWLAGVGDDAATSGRLRLFLLTHRNATFAVLADGRDAAKPMLHLFDPLGSTLHASNSQSYAVTFVATRRSGLDFNQRPAAEQAEDFFRRRFYSTLKVEDAVAAAMAAALEDDPVAGATALKAAVRRHAIVEVQEVLPGAPKPRVAGDPVASQLSAQLAMLSSPKMSVEAIYESLVAPQGGSTPGTPRNGRLSRLASSPAAELPPRQWSPATSPARASSSSPQPWDRATNPRAQSPAAAGPSHQRRGSLGEGPTTPRSPAAAKPKGILRKPSAFADIPAAAAQTASAAAPVVIGSRAGSPPFSLPLSPPRTRSRAGSVAGDFCLPSRHHGRRSSTGSVAGDFCSPTRTHSRRGSAGSEAMLFKDAGRKHCTPRAPTVSPTSPYTPRMARRKSGIAVDLQQAAAALEADLAAESRAARRHRRAASVAGSTMTAELPDSFMCKRDPAKLKAAIAKAVGSPAIVTPPLTPTGRDGGAGKQPDVMPASFGSASAAPNTAAAAATARSFARTSHSSDAGGGVRRPSADAASDVSSALRSSHSDGSGSTSNDKASASMSTDSAYGRDLPESLRGKGKPIASSPGGKGGHRLSSIPEPAPQLEGKAGGGLMAGIRSMLRWGATA